MERDAGSPQLIDRAAVAAARLPPQGFPPDARARGGRALSALTKDRVSSRPPATTAGVS